MSKRSTSADDFLWDGDTGAVRQLLFDAFNDQELTDLCFDNFRPVYKGFSSGMSTGRKIQLLLDYVVRKDQVLNLLALVRECNRPKYIAFLYRQAQAASQAEQWERVVQLCGAIEYLAPRYRDVLERRTQARVQLLYNQMSLAFQAQQWEKVVQFCDEIENLSPSYQDVSERRTQAEVRPLYDQMSVAFRAEQWKKVIQLCDEIEGLVSKYRDVVERRARAEKALMREADAEKEKEKPAITGPVPGPSVAPKPSAPRWVWALLLGLVALVVVVILLARWLASPRPVLTVESHRDGDLVERTEVITGTYRNLDAGWHLWSAVQTASGDYWVQERFLADQPGGEWSLEARFGYVGTRDIGEPFEFLVLAVEQGSDAEKYLLNARGDPVTELPAGRVHIFHPAITLFRASPTSRWLADFWDNDAWVGEPVTTTRDITATYLFQEWWGPPLDGMPETGWTASFVRRVYLPEGGEPCFYWVRRGAVDVFVDGEPLTSTQKAIDWWDVESTCRELAAGDHEVRLDYANLTDERGALEFWYDGPGLSTPQGPLSGTWHAMFLPTTDLDGQPVFAAILPGPFLEFQDTVGDAVPVVSFGAIFTRTLSLAETGTYRFELNVDDGARFVIDGVEVLDAYHYGPATYAVEKHLEAGDHTLRVEYYESHEDQYVTLTWKEIPAPIPPVQRILFASDRDGDYDIYVMDANGANQVNLTDNAVWDVDPAWSPDGGRIVFASGRDGTSLLYVMDADGTNVTPLGVSGYQPRWSPDGSRIAFIAGPEWEWEIYVMDADGANVVQLTDNDVADLTPCWSPDGSRIVFESGCDRAEGDQEIYVMDADGGNPVNLSQNPAWDGAPAWSPDGRFIAFLSNRDGNDEIYVMDADGANQRRLTYNEMEDRFPTWSPDGRFLVFEGHDPESDVAGIYFTDVEGAGPRLWLAKHWANHEHPQWSPPGYGYTFESFTDGDDVQNGAIAVVGDYVWTGGGGGLMRWNRDDPDQQRKFTSEDGLPENNVRDILADGEAALWIGLGAWPFYTDGWGRYEFGEGREHWRTYTVGDGLATDTVFDFYRDSQGRIWAGTKDGAWVYDGQRWQRLEGPIDGWVVCVYEASDGALWFELSGSDVMRYDPSMSDDAAWQRFDLMELLGSGNEGYQHASAIVEGAPGEMWITTNAGVVYYDGEMWQAVGDGLRVWTYAAVRDVNGALWFGTDRGLVRLDADGQHTYTAADGLTGGIQALALDGDGVLWAAGNGLNRYDRDSDTWTGYYAHDDESYNYASAILQDASGAVWFGHSIFYEDYSWQGGVSRYTPESDDEWQHFGTDDGLSDSAVHAIYQDSDGTLWFGFDREGGGVCRYDVGEERWLPCYQADPKGLAADEVDSIVETRDGALWFGTGGGGLSRFDGERWDTFNQANSELLSDEVHCLVEDGEGALWITTDRGINRFFYETGEWVALTTGNSDLIADEVLAVALDDSGGIWFGATEGLSHYDLATRKWRDVEGAPALPTWVQNCAQAIEVDRYGVVWVGTDEGLYRSTPEGGWLRLTAANGLASNHVLAVFEGADGALWIGTPSGISRLRVGE